MDEQINLADFLVIAERVLGVDVKALKSAAKLDAAESALAAPFMERGGRVGGSTRRSSGERRRRALVRAARRDRVEPGDHAGWQVSVSAEQSDTAPDGCAPGQS